MKICRIIICMAWVVFSVVRAEPLLVSGEEASGSDGLSGEIEMEIELESDYENESEADEFVLEKMPDLIEFVQADYPEELLKEGVEGTVLLELLIDEAGLVEEVQVISSAHSQFEGPALEAVKQFVFSPAYANDAAVAVMLQYEYRFTLQDAEIALSEYVNYRGRLLERGTRNPIPDAFVVISYKDTLSDTTLPVPFSVYMQNVASIEGQYLEEDHLVTTTDSAGNFSFSSLPLGEIEIKIPVAGYHDFTTGETIRAAEVLETVFYLVRHSYSDFEILVYGRGEEKEVSRRQLTINEVRKIPGLGGDAIKVVQALPGVGRPSLGSGDVIVRGAPTWDSKFYLDGVPIPILYHYGGLKSVYNSEALERIDFFPGGYGTRYGGSIGGAIEITGRKPKTDRWHAFADISSLDGAVFAEGPVNEDVSLMVSGRRSFIGEILNLALRATDEEIPIAITPFYWDYLLRSDVTFSQNNNLFVTLFGSRDSLGIIYPDMGGAGTEEIAEATDQFGMGMSFHMGLVGWDYQFAEKLRNSMRFSATAGRADFSVFGFVTVNEKFRLLTFRDELQYTLRDNLRFNLGADINLGHDDMVLVIPSASGVIMRDTTENWLFGVAGIYLNAEYKPIDNLQIIPGLRYDYFPELDYRGGIVPEFWDYSSFNNSRGKSGEPSLRLSTRYEVVPDHTIKAALGNYSQTPQPLGQSIHETWGNPKLSATKATHYVAGYEWQITDLINADLQFYYNNQWHIPRMARTGDMQQRDEQQQLWVGDQKGRMYGMELMLKHDQSDRFFGWLAYTLSRSQRYDENGRNWVIYGEDETHHLQLLASWRLPREWDMGFRMRYVTGKPITPITGIKEYDVDWRMYIPEYGEINSERHSPFFQLDLRADKKLVFAKWIYSFYIDLQNISWLFYKSPEFEFYNYDYSDKVTISMIPMVAVGVKLTY